MSRIIFMMPMIIMLLAIAYVYWHIWYILPFGKLGKTITTVLLLLPLLTLFGSFASDGGTSLGTMRLMQTVGTSWFFILLYLLMTFIVVDLLRLIVPAVRPWFCHNPFGSLGILLFMIGIFTYGNTNYHKKKRTETDISIAKPMDRPLKVVGVSDLHLGYTIGRDEVSAWVDKINKEKPDLILIAGDLIDSDVRPAMEEKDYEELKRLQAPMGVYACLGNHDHYAGPDKVAEFMQMSGIHLLRDTTVLVDNWLYIAGRDDRTNTGRKPLAEIIKCTDSSKPLILLDHQPYDLEEAEQANVDLQFSGHTHYGQVFPINLITGSIYEKAYGYLHKGNTNVYVSSGIGLWGGKFRIGTYSEYVVFDITGTPSN